MPLYLNFIIASVILSLLLTSQAVAETEKVASNGFHVKNINPKMITKNLMSSVANHASSLKLAYEAIDYAVFSFYPSSPQGCNAPASNAVSIGLDNCLLNNSTDGGGNSTMFSIQKKTKKIVQTYYSDYRCSKGEWENIDAPVGSCFSNGPEEGYMMVTRSASVAGGFPNATGLLLRVYKNSSQCVDPYKAPKAGAVYMPFSIPGSNCLISDGEGNAENSISIVCDGAGNLIGNGYSSSDCSGTPLFNFNYTSNFDCGSESNYLMGSLGYANYACYNGPAKKVAKKGPMASLRI